MIANFSERSSTILTPFSPSCFDAINLGQKPGSGIDGKRRRVAFVAVHRI